MNTATKLSNETRSDQATWSPLVSRLKGCEAPAEAINLNVEGLAVVGPLQGFGQLWEKTYWVRLSGLEISPAEVVRTWKGNFDQFWPEGNHFYAPLTGITPGEVALLNMSMPGGMPLSTGMLVLYADDESFTLMTPQGHFESGWITFSAHEQDGCTIAQVQSIARANDPFYEIGFWLFAHRVQEKFWGQTLTNLAVHLGIDGQVQMHKTCLDPHLQWSEVKNVWYNAAVRTAIYTPVHITRRLLNR
jgi:hypothetical protein